MDLDWHLIGELLKATGLVVVTILITRWMEKRPKLITNWIHASECRVSPPPPALPYMVHMHGVNIHNLGRAAATNVRVHHKVLPDYSVYPAIPHTEELMADGTRDIVFERILPREGVAITYLYFPPIVYGNVNDGIRSDQGYAAPVNVRLQRVYSRWVTVPLGWLVIIGGGTVVYLLWTIGKAVWPRIVAAVSATAT